MSYRLTVWEALVAITCLAIIVVVCVWAPNYSWPPKLVRPLAARIQVWPREEKLLLKRFVEYDQKAAKWDGGQSDGLNISTGYYDDYDYELRGPHGGFVQVESFSNGWIEKLKDGRLQILLPLNAEVMLAEPVGAVVRRFGQGRFERIPYEKIDIMFEDLDGAKAPYAPSQDFSNSPIECTQGTWDESASALIDERKCGFYVEVVKSSRRGGIGIVEIKPMIGRNKETLNEPNENEVLALRFMPPTDETSLFYRDSASGNDKNAMVAD